MNDIILEVRKQLKESADEKTKGSFQRFFKEEVKCYGVKSVLVVKIAKENFPEIKNLEKEEIFSLCEEFLKSGFCEEAWIAANWVYWIHDRFEQKDFKTFARGDFIDVTSHLCYI